MSRRRRRIVGAQAAAVALLVLLVYVTLLWPQGPSTLRGIEAPGGAPTTQVDTDRKPNRDPGPSGGPSPPQGSQPRPNEGAGPGGSDGAEGGSDAAALLINPTPSDDQYTDSVKALLDKLATGGGVGE